VRSGSTALLVAAQCGRGVGVTPAGVIQQHDPQWPARLLSRLTVVRPDDHFHSFLGVWSAIASATSRCRDVCGFAADDPRIAIVGLDPRHDRFGRAGARDRRDCSATVAVRAPRGAGLSL